MPRKLRELQKFIQYDIPQCRVVIAGLPYAINRYSNGLFAPGRWCFAQLAPFSEEEQKAYLGDERFEHLERLQIEVLAIPRALETLRALEVSRLQELRTAGDVYWRATETMVEKAFDNREVRREGFTTDSARWLRAMAPLYAPGNGTAEGTRRSTEMLYRNWPTMQWYARASGQVGDSARQLLHDFKSEFQGIRDGARGRKEQQIAEEFLEEFRPIPPAVDSPESLRFRMGSPPDEAERWEKEKLYETSVPGQFELACHAVTNQQYELFGPAHHGKRDEFSTEDRCPVIYVTWYDAWAFCRWLGEGFRLPSDKEWEFACRAGTTTAFHYGDSLSSNRANFDGVYPYGNAPKGPYLERTAPVGSYEPNEWGLYDMHGNVWEWCETWYHERAAEADDPNYVGSARVLRGGSWYNNARNTRAAIRNNTQPTNSNNNVGFRAAKALWLVSSFRV